MKKIYTLVGCAILSGGLFAQAPYQYATYSPGQSDKYAPGAITVIPARTEQNQDRTTYWSENFDSGLNGWVNDIILGPGVFQGFELTNTGHVNSPGNTFVIPDLMTSTPTNWIMVDSDGGNTSYSNAEHAVFVSPQIDLSAASGQYIALTFDQFFAEWDINTYTNAGSEDHCYIAVSTDSTNWTTVEINEGIGRNGRQNPEKIVWDITDYVSGSLSTVWIRFEWEGAWNYGWQIDNVAIEDNFQNDLTIVETYRQYNANGLMYSKVPLAQVEELTIGAIIRNTGNEDATNVGFSFEIKDPSNATVASGTATSTITLANLEQDTFLVSTGYTPDEIGTYTVIWTPTSDQGDDNAANNNGEDNYLEVTNFTYAMDYPEGPAEPIIEWPLANGSAEFGNLFSFAQVGVISAVEVKILNNSSNVGLPIYYKVHYNDGVNGWLELDNFEYEIESDDLGQIIGLPVGENGIDVDPANLYLVTVGQYGTPTDPIFERQGTIGFDYIQGIDEDAAYVGFFDRLAPVVRIRMNEDELSVEENPSQTSFIVYPNPANEMVTVNLTLVNSENTVINVLDITGKVIKTINVGTVNGDQNVNISVDDLTTGVYFIELVTPEGKQVKKIVKN